ncbi:MAG: hypothetical protein F6K47_00325 [Symploca sp. SIO2E6]|nr:hypothetical protein [Symploca sp. SIO2E6]
MYNKKQHIAMWSCPRSRSTAIARAFEQLDECIVFDEPLFGVYLVKQGLEKPCEEGEVGQYLETNYEKIIANITGELPKGVSFSFQKHQSKHVLPEFGKTWLKSLNNFFLIRHPKEIILSYHKAYKKKMTINHIGIKQHYELFNEISRLTDQLPLVIDSEDVVNSPHQVLPFLCDKLEITYSEKMFSWKKDTQSSSLLRIENSPYSSGWYGEVLNSPGFINKKQELEFPNELNPLLELCLPFYQKLKQYCVTFN